MLPWDGAWLDWDLYESRGLMWVTEWMEEQKAIAERRRSIAEANKNFFSPTPGGA